MHPYLTAARAVRWFLVLAAVVGWIAFVAWALVCPADAEGAELNIAAGTEPGGPPDVQVQIAPPAPPRLVPLGTFRTTGYCPCKRCTGKWAKYGRTASGCRPIEGTTVAVDPRRIPLGTRLYIEDVGYRIAQDTGKKVKGRKTDVFFRHHGDAREFGVDRLKVWRVAP